MLRISCFCTTLAAVSLAHVAGAAPRVWVIDDGEKIKQDATSLSFADGTDNPVWSPGQPVRVVALRNETTALQVVIQADATALSGVTVDLPSLSCPEGATIANATGATDPTTFVGRPIERFVEHYFGVTRASGSKDPTASLGWSSGSGPTPGAWTGAMPDALIPVEDAPAWDPYPMQIAAQNNGVAWIDVTIPSDQKPGTYTGSIAVAAGGQSLASIPVELDVVAATLPDRPLGTMLYYDPSELTRRIGDAAAEEHLWKLLHRHRLSAMHDAMSAGDVTAQLAALDGSLFTAAHGYEGPGESLGDGILSLGTYGAFGAPSATNLAKVEAIADALAAHDLFGGTDAFVYAIDESCSSSYGADWKSLLSGSTDPNAQHILVGWTCSRDPSTQPVDVPIVFADSYDLQQVAAARAAGKRPWIYNGSRPQTDAFLTDTAAVAPRANAWVAAAAGIERWFYWETTFWYDDNPGGNGPYDPFVTAETFHNSSGDWCEGDGVLLYPRKQVDMFTEHSVGESGVLPSVRLKNLRRGVEDAGYYALAHAAAPSQAEAVASGLLGADLSKARSGKPVAWPERGARWYEARAALRALIRPNPVPPDPGADAGGDAAQPGDAGAGGAAGGGAPDDAQPGGGLADVGSSGAGNAGAGDGDGSAPGGGPTANACGCVAAGHSGAGASSRAALLGAALLGLAVRRRPRQRE